MLGAGRLVGSCTYGKTVVRPFAAPSARPQVQRRATVVVFAADEKKKRMDDAVKRALIAEERRKQNRTKKSACWTRTKKVIKLAETFGKTEPTDADVANLDKLVAEAYKEIDMARSKGIMHINTAARRKARVAKYKRQALITAGLYTPTPEQPGYRFYELMQKK